MDNAKAETYSSVIQHLREGDIGKAKEILDSKKNLQDAEWWAYMSFCSDKPKDDALRAVSLNPNSAIANIALGLAKHAESWDAAGLKELDKAIKLSPTSLSYNARGRTLCSIDGKRSSAIADFSKAIQLDPQNVSSYFNRANAYRNSDALAQFHIENEKELDKVLKELSIVLSIQPRMAQVYECRGMLYESMSNYDKAIAEYSRAIELNPQRAVLPYPVGSRIAYPESLPQSAGAFWLRSQCYVFKGEWKKAIDDYSKLIDSGQIAFRERAEAYRRINQPKEAVQDYAAALANIDKIAVANPKIADHPDLVFRRAMILSCKAVEYLELKDYMHAKEDADKAIGFLESPKIRNHNTFSIMLTNPYFTRGICNTVRGLHKEAVRDYTKAIQHVPDHSHYYLNRAASYVALKDYKHAVEDYSKVLELAPTNALTYFQRGKCWLALNSVDKALADFNKAGSLLPDPSTSYGIAFYRAEAYSLQGKHKEAILDLTRAIGLSDRRSADAFANRAKEYFKIGDYSSAFMDLLFASTLSPKWASLLLMPVAVIFLVCFAFFRMAKQRKGS